MDFNVMIVDDNEYVRGSIETYFQAKGIQAIGASGGEECLQHLEAGFKGVLLMDVMMPLMDGWDTIRQIVARGLYDGNAILMLTAKDEPDDEMEGIQEFITDYVTKPFQPAQLLATVSYYGSLLKGPEQEH